MGYVLKQGQASQPLVFLMVDSTDHIAGKTGLSPTVTLSKNGGPFGDPAGAVIEVGSGWYKVAGDSSDSDTLGPLLLHATATGADPTDDRFEVVAYDPQSVANLGLSALPAAAPGTEAGLPTVDAENRVKANIEQVGGESAIMIDGPISANVVQVNGQAASTSVEPISVNVIQVGGHALGAKVGSNLDTFFQNAGADTDAVADDLGGSADWTASEREQIRHRLGLDGLATAPNATPSLSIYDGGPVASVIAPVTAGTVHDKTGYRLAADGLDAISVADPGPPADHTTISRMLVALWRRSFKKTSLNSRQYLTYADDGITVNSSQGVSDDGSTQIMDAAR